MGVIRPCHDLERPRILEIVNCAAEAYRDVIPPDRWHEPYMPSDELDQELSAGVRFWAYEADGALVGVMGIQRVRDVELIRHAYVLPVSQGHGVGAALLEHLQRVGKQRMLVGTWAAAEWAIRFYRRHGFQLVAPERTAALLKAYWTIPDRQITTSVVLANPPFAEDSLSGAIRSTVSAAARSSSGAPARRRCRRRRYGPGHEPPTYPASVTSAGRTHTPGQRSFWTPDATTLPP